MDMDIDATNNTETEANISQQANKKRIINRLRRLEGQVRGLQRMIEDGRECKEVLILLSGIRSAMDATGDLILENYLTRCQADFLNGTSNSKEIISALKLVKR